MYERQRDRHGYIDLLIYSWEAFQYKTLLQDLKNCQRHNFGVEYVLIALKFCRWLSSITTELLLEASLICLNPISQVQNIRFYIEKPCQILKCGGRQGDGAPGVSGVGVGGLLTKRGRGQMGDGAGGKSEFWMVGTRKKTNRGKKGAGVGSKNWGGAEGWTPGGRGSRPHHPPLVLPHWNGPQLLNCWY